jgi:hypothetical protein
VVRKLSSVWNIVGPLWSNKRNPTNYIVYICTSSVTNPLDNRLTSLGEKSTFVIRKTHLVGEVDARAFGVLHPCNANDLTGGISTIDSCIPCWSNVGALADYAGQFGASSPSIMTNTIRLLAHNKVYICTIHVTHIYILDLCVTRIRSLGPCVTHGQIGYVWTRSTFLLKMTTEYMCIYMLHIVYL